MASGRDCPTRQLQKAAHKLGHGNPTYSETVAVGGWQAQVTVGEYTELGVMGVNQRVARREAAANLLKRFDQENLIPPAAKDKSRLESSVELS